MHELTTSEDLDALLELIKEGDDIIDHYLSGDQITDSMIRSTKHAVRLAAIAVRVSSITALAEADVENLRELRKRKLSESVSQLVKEGSTMSLAEHTARISTEIAQIDDRTAKLNSAAKYGRAFYFASLELTKRIERACQTQLNEARMASNAS